MAVPSRAHPPRQSHHIIEWPSPKGKELRSSKAGATAEKPWEVLGPGARDGHSHNRSCFGGGCIMPPSQHLCDGPALLFWASVFPLKK